MRGAATDLLGEAMFQQAHKAIGAIQPTSLF